VEALRRGQRADDLTLAGCGHGLGDRRGQLPAQHPAERPAVRPRWVQRVFAGQLGEGAALVLGLAAQLAGQVFAGDQDQPQPGSRIVGRMGGEVLGDAVTSQVRLELRDEQVALQGGLEVGDRQSLLGEPGERLFGGSEAVALAEVVGGLL
jgi:hypothetical protein